MFASCGPLVNTQIRLINSVNTTNKILPAGSVYTVRYNDEHGCFLEDEKGLPIYDYFAVANFVRI